MLESDAYTREVQARRAFKSFADVFRLGKERACWIPPYMLIRAYTLSVYRARPKRPSHDYVWGSILNHRQCSGPLATDNLGGNVEFAIQYKPSNYRKTKQYLNNNLLKILCTVLKWLRIVMNATVNQLNIKQCIVSICLRYGEMSSILITSTIIYAPGSMRHFNP